MLGFDDVRICSRCNTSIRCKTIVYLFFLIYEVNFFIRLAKCVVMLPEIYQKL